MKWLINKIVGSKNQRELKKLGTIVNKINELELEYQAQRGSFKEKTFEWKEKLKSFESELDDSIETWKTEQLGKILRPTADDIRNIEEDSRIRKMMDLKVYTTDKPNI